MIADSNSNIAWHRVQLKKNREALKALEIARFRVGGDDRIGGSGATKGAGRSQAQDRRILAMHRRPRAKHQAPARNRPAQPRTSELGQLGCPPHIKAGANVATLTRLRTVLLRSDRNDINRYCPPPPTENRHVPPLRDQRRRCTPRTVTPPLPAIRGRRRRRLGAGAVGLCQRHKAAAEAAERDLAGCGARSVDEGQCALCRRRVAPSRFQERAGSAGRRPKSLCLAS